MHKSGKKIEPSLMNPFVYCKRGHYTCHLISTNRYVLHNSARCDIGKKEDAIRENSMGWVEHKVVEKVSLTKDVEGREGAIQANGK